MIEDDDDDEDEEANKGILVELQFSNLNIT